MVELFNLEIYNETKTYNLSDGQNFRNELRDNQLFPQVQLDPVLNGFAYVDRITTTCEQTGGVDLLATFGGGSATYRVDVAHDFDFNGVNLIPNIDISVYDVGYGGGSTKTNQQFSGSGVSTFDDYLDTPALYRPVFEFNKGFLDVSGNHTIDITITTKLLGRRP